MITARASKTWKGTDGQKLTAYFSSFFGDAETLLINPL